MKTRPLDLFAESTALKVFHRKTDGNVVWALYVDVGFRSWPRYPALMVVINGTYENGNLVQGGVINGNYWWNDSKQFQVFWENLLSQENYLKTLKINSESILAEVEKWASEYPLVEESTRGEDTRELLASGDMRQITSKRPSVVKDLLKELHLNTRVVSVLIDGKRAEFDDKIPEGAEVTILPLIRGGCYF